MQGWLLNKVAMVWSAYMYFTECMALLVYVLYQPVHLGIMLSLHQLDFFVEIFLWRLVSVLCK